MYRIKNNEEIVDLHRSEVVPAPRAWDISELRTAVDRYEEMLRAADKKRATVATYVEHAERFVNWLDGRYTPHSPQQLPPIGYHVSERPSKYDPLRAHLEARDDDGAVDMTFKHIERVLGFRLPGSARRYAHWWANDRTGNHAQAAAWLRAGRRVARVDLIDERVKFVRVRRTPSG